MKTKFLSLLVACFIVTSVFSQANLNNYKYIIIPKKYGFLKDNDQFQLNSLTAFLFNKYGFEAFMEGEAYPDDLNVNRCLALTSDLIKDSSLFKTKLAIELKDCNGLSVYTTQEGESREKDFNKAYAEALRNAFKELESIDYHYVPVANTSKLPAKQLDPIQSEVGQEIAQLKAEIENLRQEKVAQVNGQEKPKAAVPVVEVSKSPVENNVAKEEISKVVATSENMSDVLYAQAIENGFQLVDSSPKVVYRIKNTSLENVFMVEGKNATLYKKENNWIMEYYENNVLKQEVLNIKF